MTKPKRFEPSIDFPAYAFLPGQHVHPNKSGGYRHLQDEPDVAPIDLHAPEQNKYFRHGIDLLNYGYFWESHVYFEALWNVHQRTGPVADFLKALIKIAAGGIKHQLGQTAAFKGHLERALEICNELREQKIEKVAGFHIEELSNRLNMSVETISMGVLPLYPSWN